MNVYDTANKLAEEIKTSQEYLKFKELKEKINNTPNLKEKIKDFELKRQNLQMQTLSGKQPSEEETMQVQKIYTELINNEETKDYLEYEMKFSVLIADVNKIIGDAIKDVLK